MSEQEGPVDSDLDKVQANFDGFSSEFQVLYKEFQEKIGQLSKKQAFRVLEAIVAFPLEHDKVALPAGSDEIMELACQIYTVKQNMTLAYMMDSTKAAAEQAIEDAKNAEIEEAEVVEE